jgi:hypothetical protein
VTAPDQPIPYSVTEAGRAYVRAFVECLTAGYSTRTALEIAERARDRVLLVEEQDRLERAS